MADYILTKGADLKVGDHVAVRGQRRVKKRNYVYEVISRKQMQVLVDSAKRIKGNKFKSIDPNVTYDRVTI